MIDKTHLIKEVCVETYGEAIKAEKLGADRIELCKRLDLGGLTPQRELIEQTLSLSLPIKVMIRPRAGNFIYNENELTIMEDEIETCKSIGVQEVVLGLLDTEKNVDIKSTNLSFLDGKNIFNEEIKINELDILFKKIT